MYKVWILILSLLSFDAFSAPKSEPWPFWDKHTQSTQRIDHSQWQILLDSYLVERGENTLFRYASVTDKDKQALKAYVSSLAGIDPRQYSQAEQYAYWVNLYNALTVDLILDNYPVKSITKLGGLFSFGPWGEEIIEVAGKPLSLNDIEHRILRPIWQDPRTHYAVNCASLGCPNLQAQAFTADNTEQLLEQSAHAFINSGKGAKLSNGKLQLSSIYDWFAVDFDGEQGVLRHLAKYRSDLTGFEGKVSFDYDWKLNKAD
ncbi:DUF547 domain-containing protein [Vibrio breoganii]|uniref:DUF547 domain-containing protein n=1 Tax=Vibrio breoganii TaxID=553239 RepID=UPI000C846C99|nr:DUF547 domain-containing protein [Vibrio breoganii]PMI23988.1 hypothetical protein BCU49_03000 [Vibrio breoganii]PMK27895.1 hypothetical protein BCU03_15345 [Vibrio breoganii]PML24032.1 hypothetical protein BCT82_13965 [Vibrio breoganii]PMM47491.1 hypothetical protein BCT52_06780 [Vibrio breoganii]